MRKFLAAALALCATPVLAQGVVAPKGSVPPPPPLTPPLPTPASLAPLTRIQTYGPPPSVIRCEGRDVRVIESAPFHPDVNVRYVASGAKPSSGDQPASALVFAVDAKGAPIDIRRAPNAQADQNLIASFARWRFAPGQAAAGCRLEVPQTFTPLAKATTAVLLEHIATRKREASPVVRAALSARGDCGKAPRRAPALISYPDLRRFDDRDFAGAWAGVLYDIDAEGVVRNVRIAAQGGDPVLADQAAFAIAESRFQSGKPVKGCYGVQAARPRPTDAPPRTPTKPIAKPQIACRVELAALNLSLDKAYPAPFARERVEGWALLQFDITPEGRVWPIEILGAQPVETFGLAARSMLYKARPDRSVWGQKGCLIPVTFAIPDIVED